METRKDIDVVEARAHYMRQGSVELSNENVPEDLVKAIEAHDLEYVRQAFTQSRKYLHAKVQLGTFGGRRLTAYWRYGHVAHFKHYCSLLHWSVHVASLAEDKDAANAVVSLLLQAGANPTVRDGWGHDVFELACTDPHRGGGIDMGRDSAECRLLIDYVACADHSFQGHMEDVPWAEARAYFMRRGKVTLSQTNVPEDLVKAIEAHDLPAVQEAITCGRQYLHAKVQLGKVGGSRLMAYWRYGHVAYFKHYCSPLHWAVHIASLSYLKDKEAALSVISWLLQVGANPAVEDGWGHDVFELSCTDPSSTVGIDVRRADSMECQLLIGYMRTAPKNGPLRLGYDLGRCKDAPWEDRRMRQLLASHNTVKLPQPDFKLNAKQAGVLIKKMQALDPSDGPAVDDHVGTPIGQGFTVGVLFAQLSTDPELLSLLPKELQVGLFDGRFDKNAADVIMRISHTNAVDTDLMRIALKVHLGDEMSTNLTFTETITTFPIGNKEQFDAFIHGEDRGTGQMLLNHFTSSLGLAANAMSTKNSGTSDPSFDASVLGKSYYSLTPFAIGPAAAKFALKSDLRLAEAVDHQKGSLQAGLIKEIAAADTVFDLMVQVSLDGKKQPVDDCSVLWDEMMTPFIKMGELRVPRQELHGVNTPNAGMSKALDGQLENTKQLQFSIGESSLHEPLGFINQFRAQFYPMYGDARQKHFLGDTDAPGVCPMRKAGLALAAAKRMRQVSST